MLSVCKNAGTVFSLVLRIYTKYRQNGLCFTSAEGADLDLGICSRVSELHVLPTRLIDSNCITLALLFKASGSQLLQAQLLL